MPWTWKSDETKPAVSTTRAIWAFNALTLPAVTVTGWSLAEYSAPRLTKTW